MCDMYPQLEREYECIYDEEVFDDLPPVVQEDLEAWFNTSPNDKEKQMLLALYTTGKFQVWHCPECAEERVYRGNPDSYDCFQGVLNQDFSYFGNKEKFTEQYINAMCDYCRCYA